ncbi:hypothetical protein [Amycolatopsis sp. GM8]|uniref:hypothetical protein n=1 Tax=Amycolatopsis sp. GM8 TaxID=2896530 RepID=UPI001F455CA3|nr:hypothetical protein [Amycolatopsis sp. GM8]
MGEAVMAYQPHRHGVHATINGRTYPARYNSGKRVAFISLAAPENPDPGLFTWQETHELWVAQVPAGECDRVFRISPYARFFGHRCYVDGLTGESAELIYAGTDQDWAQRNGFEQHDRGTFRRTVPSTELYDYHEEQWDLLFDDWRVQTFGEAP